MGTKRVEKRIDLYESTTPHSLSSKCKDPQHPAFSSDEQL